MTVRRTREFPTVATKLINIEIEAVVNERTVGGVTLVHGYSPMSDITAANSFNNNSFRRDTVAFELLYCRDFLECHKTFYDP